MTYLDKIEQALEAVPNEARVPGSRFSTSGTATTTLGGLVDSCRISGEVLIDDGLDDGQAVAVIPIEIVTA
jgi:hypothetical protein